MILKYRQGLNKISIRHLDQKTKPLQKIKLLPVYQIWISYKILIGVIKNWQNTNKKIVNIFLNRIWIQKLVNLYEPRKIKKINNKLNKLNKLK